MRSRPRSSGCGEAWRATSRAAAVLVRTVALVVFAASVLSCDGPGNTGQQPPDPSVGEAVPWLNGVLPVVDAGAVVIPSTPIYPPIATGLPDPGSRADSAVCAIASPVLARIETSPGWFENFEPAFGGTIGVAVAWTGFDDLTKYSFHVPGDISWYPGLMPKYNSAPIASPWGLPAVQVGGPACDGNPNNWSLHYRGGLFRNWGGGVSHVFTDPTPPCALNTMFNFMNTGCPMGLCPPMAACCSTNPMVCPGSSAFDSAGLPICGLGGCPYKESHEFIDASTYEGIAFWARRGPEGQDRLIVTFTDNFTSDRLARENQKFCRRSKPCHTRCLNGAPCTLDPGNPNAIPFEGPTYRCFDPTGPVPSSVVNSAQGASTPTSQIDLMYPRCGSSACSSPSYYKDPDFDGKECRPYTFPASEWYIAGEFCFNENDPPPPDRDQRCLDGWATTVQLTLDWQYYTVPFTQFQQGGFGKVAPYMNLKALDTVAFGFIVGWADVYLDNISFYRRK